MAISKELFMAILSMDSYNHGKNAVIEDGILRSHENLAQLRKLFP